MTTSYVLILKNRVDREIEVGKLGMIKFSKGHYFYVGSANNGIGRIKRHFRREKKLKWHIDYISAVFEVIGAVILRAEECEVAESFTFEGIKGFGCSDCRCRTHLFYSPNLTLEFLPT
jgi:Uri superfamily endonuclease